MTLGKKDSDEVREESVSLALQRKAVEPNNRGIIREVAAQLNIGERSTATRPRMWLYAPRA